MVQIGFHGEVHFLLIQLENLTPIFSKVIKNIIILFKVFPGHLIYCRDDLKAHWEHTKTEIGDQIWLH